MTDENKNIENNQEENQNREVRRLGCNPTTKGRKLKIELKQAA